MTKQANETGTQNGFFGMPGMTEWTEWTEIMRDLAGIQMRSMQFVVEKGYNLGHVWTDFMQHQVSEGVKLSQECMKYGWDLANGAKATAQEFSARTFQQTTK